MITCEREIKNESPAGGKRGRSLSPDGVCCRNDPGDAKQVFFRVDSMLRCKPIACLLRWPYPLQWPSIAGRSIVIFLLSWMIGAACYPAGLLAQEATKTTVQVRKDVPYLVPDQTPDAYRRERCRLDWYLPSGQETFPILIWFHGGGLRSGEKDGEHEIAIARRFAESGVAVASINYRLSPKARFPAYLEDAGAAVAYVHRQAAEVGGDPRKVFVSGHSAGGYLTLMVALDPLWLKPHELSPADLAGYLPVSGQTITHSTIRAERGISENQPVIDSAAPSFHVLNPTSPILCLAGGKDLPARAEENRYLVAMLQANDHPQARYLEFADRDHGSIAFKIPEPGDEVFQAMMQFLQDVAAKQD